MKISILIPTGILLAVYWIRYFVTERKKGVSFLLPLVFTCLFIPKLNLIRVNRIHYNTAGIRPDDILTLVLFLAALKDKRTWKNRYIRWGIGFLAALTAANLVSMFTGRANGYDNGVLFSILSIVRKYEYFAFALIGICIARKSENAEKTILEEFTSILEAGVINEVGTSVGSGNDGVMPLRAFAIVLHHVAPAAVCTEDVDATGVAARSEVQFIIGQNGALT